MTRNAKVAIVYHSGYGHTKVQAEAVLRGAQSAAQAEIYEVGSLSEDLSEIADADAIIFGTPTYMGNVSGPFKTFMDKSSGIWAQQGWNNKIAGGFTNSSSPMGDKGNTLLALATFGAQHGMLWVGLDLPPGNNSSTGSEDSLNRMGASLGAMAQSLADKGPDVTPPDADQRTAEYYGARVAKVAQRWLAAGAEKAQ